MVLEKKMTTATLDRKATTEPKTQTKFPRPVPGSELLIEEPRLPIADQRRHSEALLDYLNAVNAELLKKPVEVQTRRASASRRVGHSFGNEIALGFVRDRRLRVIKPIKVTFSKVEGQSAAEAAEFGEYGYGATRAEALGDLQQAIVELYVGLKEADGRLGKDLHAVWKKLQQSLSWYER